MEFSNFSFRFSLIAVFLLQVSESSRLPTPSRGLLGEMPKNCSNAGFCLEKHHDYPQDIIDDLLSNKYHIQLGNVHEDVPVDRQGFYDDQQNDCEKKITYGEIYEIVDASDNIRVVVQSPKQFKQQIRIEQCVKPGRLLTKSGTEHFFPEDLKNNPIFCDEKKMEYSFLVLTPDGKGVESVRSKHGIPVSCHCKFGHSNSLL